MSILGLFIASLMASLKLLLLTAVGATLALQRVGIMGEEARKHMNIVSFFVFNPSLVASNVAKTLTFKSVVKLWFMPFNILITFIVGSFLGWLLLKVIKVPRVLRPLVVGCCSAGNVGTILLIIIPAVCKERSSPLGAADVCDAHGLAYASLSMAVGSIMLWLYVYNMVRVAATGTEISGLSNSEESIVKNDDVNNKLATPSPEDISKHSTGLLIPSEILTHSEDNTNQMELERKPDELQITMRFEPEKPKLRTMLESIALHIKDIVAKYLNLKTLFAPSTVGAIIGLLIGIIGPLRKIMIGDTAPLRVVQDSTSLLGDAAIPTITLVMGSNLVQGLRKSDLKLSVLISIIVVRYLILPVIGVAVLKFAIHFGFVNHDPLYEFILLLQFTNPPAINIGTITQLFGVGEKECSVIFLSTYALAPVGLTLWSTLFLWLVS